MTSASSVPVVGRVLVAHGLNTRPAVMDELVIVLRSAGLSSRRVSLHPPEGSRRESAEEVRLRWLRTVAQAHEELAVETPVLPVHAVGYSLGAVVVVAHLTATGSAFDRMVLLAPPFALTRTASSVRALTPLWRTGLSLPSAAPRSVRQRSWTPLSDYAALLSLVSGLEDLADAGHIGRIPTRVVVDPSDELVSAPGVRAWVARHRLPAWQVDEIQDRVPARRTSRHLVITEPALGPAAWRWLTSTTVGHLTPLTT